MPCKKVLYIIGLLLLHVHIFSQNECVAEELQSNDYQGRKDSLVNIYGFKKNFLAGYELPAIAALSFYPELDSTHIAFKSKVLSHFGNARPKMDFLFRQQKERHHVIIINKDAKDILGIAFSDLPFNAQIGFFGHELAHITDYTDKSNFQIILYGVKYLFMKRAIEIHTDQIAIKHNLGCQIYDLRNFVLNNPGTDKDYLKYIRNSYLDHKEILHEISKFNECQ